MTQDPSPLSDELVDYTAQLPRRRRFRLAGKRLRLEVYQAIEVYIAISAVLLALTQGLGLAGLATLLKWNLLPVLILGIGHDFGMLTRRPWHHLASAFEAFIAWLILVQLTPGLVPSAWAWAIYLFIGRAWFRARTDLRLDAARNLERYS